MNRFSQPGAKQYYLDITEYILAGPDAGVDEPEPESPYFAHSEVTKIFQQTTEKRL